MFIHMPERRFTVKLRFARAKAVLRCIKFADGTVAVRRATWRRESPPAEHPL